MRKYIVGAILLIVLPLVASLFIAVSSRAQETGDPITLGVSPQLLEVTANPGEKISNTFRLTNGSDQAVEINTIPKNFTPNGEEGAVFLTEDNTTYAISEWTSVSPQSATLQAKTTTDFVVNIDVPQNAEPGSHFGSVVFQTVPPEDDEAAALVSQEIAPVILVRIAGDVTESAEIEEFKSTQSFWSNQKSISFTSRIRNTGTVHFKPTGQIVIKDMFGREVKTIELDKRNVLPDSIRQIPSEWSDFGFLLGMYTAELTVVTGEDNQISTSKTSFTVFPYQIVVPIVIGLLIIVFLLYKGRKRISLALKALSGKENSEK